MSDSNNTKAIIRAKHRRAAKKAPVAPRTINRKGGGTPPSSTITGASRIRGIQNKVLKSAVELLGDNPAPKMVAHLEEYIGLEPSTCPLNLSEREFKRVETAFNAALRLVPDSSRLPADTMPGSRHSEPAPTTRKRRQQMEAPKVMSYKRVVPADDTPTTQIEQILGRRVPQNA
jgi:hypothetical protein